MAEQMTREDLELVLDGWCADMIRAGWTIDSRAGGTAAARRSNRGWALIQGVAITFAAWFAAALAYPVFPGVIFYALVLAGPLYTVRAVLEGVARRVVTVDADGVIHDV